MKTPKFPDSCKNNQVLLFLRKKHMPKLTQTFYKILNTDTGHWFASKNSKTVWAQYSGASTTITANDLDRNIYVIYEFVATGVPVERGN